jgi:hypothetical protein
MRGDRGRPMTPGPGQYQTRTMFGNEAPKVHISSVKPDVMTPKEARLVPGPGQYMKGTIFELRINGTCHLHLILHL